ncbi:MAG: hypothetical protein GX217_05200 [Clostridiaceae bacterium]|nr:hypothetical protein [Clostridiaceae bacterium]
MAVETDFRRFNLPRWTIIILLILLLLTIIHVVQISSKIFELRGFYNATNEDVVSKQRDLIGISLDKKH